MHPELPRPTAPKRGTVLLILGIFLVLASARFLTNFAIEYQWWKEMEQVPTWVEMLLYSIAPAAAGTLIAFLVLLVAHGRALRFAGTRLGEHRLYAVFPRSCCWACRGCSLRGLLIRGPWSATSRAKPPCGGHGLARFDFWATPGLLPVRSPVLHGAATVFVGAGGSIAVVYWAAGRGWQLVARLPELQQTEQFDPRMLRLEGALESRFLRGVAAVVLLALGSSSSWGATKCCGEPRLHGRRGLRRREDHLPLQWLLIFSSIAAAIFAFMGRWKIVVFFALAFVLRTGVPALVSAVYVKPNEISIQRPYIQKHIQATRSAFGLEKRTREVEFAHRWKPGSILVSTNPFWTTCGCGLACFP